MRLWITRTQPGAARLADALAAAGHECVVAPVLAIEPQAPPTVAPDVQLAIFLSEHAVTPGLALLRGAAGQIRVLAVGPQTALALAAVGVAAAVPATPSSEGLLAMPELREVQDCRVLVCAGEGGRDALVDGLVARGALVTRVALYRRVPVPAAQLLQRLQEVRASTIDAIVVSSGDGLRSAAQVWFGAEGSAAVWLFTPSDRVAHIAQALGFERVVVCAGAGPSALLQALAEVVN